MGTHGATFLMISSIGCAPFPISVPTVLGKWLEITSQVNYVFVLEFFRFAFEETPVKIIGIALNTVFDTEQRIRESWQLDKEVLCNDKPFPFIFYSSSYILLTRVKESSLRSKFL